MTYKPEINIYLNDNEGIKLIQPFYFRLNKSGIFEYPAEPNLNSNYISEAKKVKSAFLKRIKHNAKPPFNEEAIIEAVKYFVEKQAKVEFKKMKLIQPKEQIKVNFKKKDSRGLPLITYCYQTKYYKARSIFCNKRGQYCIAYETDDFKLDFVALKDGTEILLE